MALKYVPPRWLRNGHLQTVLPMFTRRLPQTAYQRERIDTPDGDFLDLDILGDPGCGRAAIISHGLEGSSSSIYVRGMARALAEVGWCAVAWNYRGCSGEINRRPRTYHAGATEDLDVVVQHLLRQGVTTLVLVGFSLGGNLTLKYLGERGDSAPDAIRAAAAFSVPCDLASSTEALTRPANVVYLARFMRSLRAKIRGLAAQFPGEIDPAGLATMRTFREFDDRYTARLHGFADASDYWVQCSSKRFLSGIRRPTLIVNALDDPFLARACFPVREAAANPQLTFETPRHGGHVGFVQRDAGRLYWSEARTLAFLRQLPRDAGTY